MEMEMDRNNDNNYQVFNVLGGVTGLLTFSCLTAMVAWKMYRRYRRRQRVDRRAVYRTIPLEDVVVPDEDDVKDRSGSDLKYRDKEMDDDDESIC